MVTSKSPFWAQLKQASYRGQKFAVLNGSGHFGRRNAVHEYPFRDTPWVEDIGRAARRVMVTGFLLGDDVIAQRDSMIAKAEAKGDGKLVHPTLGEMTVAMLDFSCAEHWDRGRYFEINFTFIVQGQRQFPSASQSGQQQISTDASATDAAASSTFSANTATLLSSGAPVASQAQAQAQSALALANQSISGATGLLSLAVLLPGAYGRLLGQAAGIDLSQVVSQTSGATIQSLEAVAAISRVSVGTAAVALAAAGAALGPSSVGAFAVAAQALTEALRIASPTPGDALNALAALAALPASGSAVGAAATMQTETVNLLHRAAVTSLARASGQYQPSSANDAMSALTMVAAAIDNEITVAGDQGDDAVYQSLRQLRADVVLDMQARGAALPALRTVNTNFPVPSLVLAQRLYQDPTRADELVRRANPVHPAFMPLSFSALSS